MNQRFLPGILALACAFGSVAQAQTISSPTNPQGPLNPQAQVPVLRYTSSLSTYRSFSDLNVGSWREANDRVGRIGGWRVYQQEALSPAMAPSQPAR